MTEVELKAVVHDPAAARTRVEAAGGVLDFEGALEDRRYDTRTSALARRDHVLRTRVYRDSTGARATVDWKGATRQEGGYKVREEIGAAVADPDALALILQRLGYRVSREIDREVAQYALGEATVRFERYPQMDVLVEVEGPPAEIERAIAVLAMPRDAFTGERLVDFVRRFEERTGRRAALNHREAAGNVPRRAVRR